MEQAKKDEMLVLIKLLEDGKEKLGYDTIHDGFLMLEDEPSVDKEEWHEILHELKEDGMLDIVGEYVDITRDYLIESIVITDKGYQAIEKLTKKSKFKAFVEFLKKLDRKVGEIAEATPNLRKLIPSITGIFTLLFK